VQDGLPGCIRVLAGAAIRWYAVVDEKWLKIYEYEKYQRGFLVDKVVQPVLKKDWHDLSSEQPASVTRHHRGSNSTACDG
jgi:hypothetical protein